jgi:SAM-dependent methyltransferase
VGAQTAILLAEFPELCVTGIDVEEAQLAEARRSLGELPWARGRYDFQRMNAERLDIEPGLHDAAFVCWVLEHVASPVRVLTELRRVLAPGAVVVCTEVHNATLFLHPPCPHTQTFWAAFNARQVALGGDPVVGGKLGNLLVSAGFRDVITEVKTFFFDRRTPEQRAEFLPYFRDLLLSAAPGLLEAGSITGETTLGMTAELERAAYEDDSVFFYSFIRAIAVV